MAQCLDWRPHRIALNVHFRAQGGMVNTAHVVEPIPDQCVCGAPTPDCTTTIPHNKCSLQTVHWVHGLLGHIAESNIHGLHTRSKRKVKGIPGQEDRMRIIQSRL